MYPKLKNKKSIFNILTLGITTLLTITISINSILKRKKSLDNSLKISETIINYSLYSIDNSNFIKVMFDDESSKELELPKNFCVYESCFNSNLISYSLKKDGSIVPSSIMFQLEKYKLEIFKVKYFQTFNSNVKVIVMPECQNLRK